MIPKKLITKKFLVGSVLGAILSAAIISGCAVDTDWKPAEILTATR